jgi:hypothetical protein
MRSQSTCLEQIGRVIVRNTIHMVDWGTKPGRSLTARARAVRGEPKAALHWLFSEVLCQTATPSSPLGWSKSAQDKSRYVIHAWSSIQHDLRRYIEHVCSWHYDDDIDVSSPCLQRKYACSRTWTTLAPWTEADSSGEIWVRVPLEEEQLPWKFAHSPSRICLFRLVNLPRGFPAKRKSPKRFPRKKKISQEVIYVKIPHLLF